MSWGYLWNDSVNAKAQTHAKVRKQCSLRHVDGIALSDPLCPPTRATKHDDNQRGSTQNAKNSRIDRTALAGRARHVKTGYMRSQKLMTSESVSCAVFVGLRTGRTYT